MPWFDSITKLRAKGVTFADGLTSEECESAERAFGIKFPEDYREFLREALPVGERFPDWRHCPESIAESLEWPWEGMAFDIDQNAWWIDLFGSRPPSLDEALKVARSHYDEAPKLIPIYGHRFIPSEPLVPCNPVFSVYQMDIIYYGSNLQEYFEIEFLGRAHSTMSHSFRPIRFWDDVAE